MFWPRAKVPTQSQGSVMTQQPILEKGRNVGLGRKDNKCQGENTCLKSFLWNHVKDMKYQKSSYFEQMHACH